MTAAALCVALCAALPLAAQERDERTTTVGMPARVEGIVLPGPPLEARPRDRDASLALRVVATWPHGTDTRYDLEYYGLEPGTYDLAAWLVRPDGTVPDGLPAVAVEVTTTLPPGRVEPSPVDVRRAPSMGGYRAWMTVGAVLWGMGLVALVVRGRRRRDHERAAAVEARPPTLAERLEPSVRAAMEGRLDEAGKAELERLLLAHWRERLDLGSTKSARAVARLREHETAGRLLRRLEEWLHRPPGARRADPDLAELLAPYRDVPADGGAAVPPAGGRA